MFDLLKVKTLAAAALALVVSSGAALAVVVGPKDVSNGDSVADVGILIPGDTVSFQYNAVDTFRVPDFSLTANGFSFGADISNLTIDLFRGGTLQQTLAFSPVNIGNPVSNATEIFGNLVLTSGDSFRVNVFETSGPNSLPVLLTLTFAAVPVPLPAGGLLLLTALAGGGMAMRRRRAQLATA